MRDPFLKLESLLVRGLYETTSPEDNAVELTPSLREQEEATKLHT
jgi:hypothetical protein